MCRAGTSAALGQLSLSGGRRGPVVPGHPLLRGLGRVLVIPQQLGQVVQGIGVTQEAGVNQAHEQVADEGPSAALVKERVLAVADRHLDRALIVPSWSSLFSRKRSC